MFWGSEVYQKKILCVIFLVYFLTSCQNRIRNINTQYIENLEPIKSYKLNEVNFEEETIANTHVYVDVEIQGEVFPFIIDLGDLSHPLRISENTAARINIKDENNTYISKSLYGKYINNKISIPSVNSINMEKELDNCVITDNNWFWPWNIVKPTMGMAGWSFFEGYNFLIDYPNKVLEIYPEEFVPQKIKDWNKIFYSSSSSKKINFIQCNIENMEVKLILDNGAGGYIQNENNFELTNNLFNKMKNRRIISNNEILETKARINDTDLNLKFNLIKVPIFLSFFYDGFLGWAFFYEHPIFIDQSNQTIFFGDSNA